MTRDTKIAAAVFLAIPVAILGAATACTWAIANGASERWRVAFRILCHGIAARCLTPWEVPMPICARCTAIYAGLFAGLLLFCAIPRLSESVLRFGFIAAAVLMAIDGGTQALGMRESTNALRLATGFPFGLLLGAWTLGAIEKAVRRRLLDAI